VPIFFIDRGTPLRQGTMRRRNVLASALSFASGGRRYRMAAVIVQQIGS
jgi:hypothetical protein